MSDADAHWVFGYGSLIWKPDFAFIEAAPARLPGYKRRFWQGSHDHRGLPERPGRVVTLIADAAHHCDGMAYLIEAHTVTNTFEQLDHREKNGYQRVVTELQLHDGRAVSGLVYIAPEQNFAYLGEAEPMHIAAQILRSSGPSGHNVDYLLELARALRALNADDAHVFELESLVLAMMK
jgi:cation transport regulator ChaC